MSVKIRMKRMGRKNRAYYRICASDIRAPRDGRVIEELGTYDPLVPETDARAILNGERIAYWLSVGAQVSPKVNVLIKKYGKGGTHLEAQAQAISRLGQRRAVAIAAALKAAQEIPPPKPAATAEVSADAESSSNHDSSPESSNEPETVGAAESSDSSSN